MFWSLTHSDSKNWNLQAFLLQLHLSVFLFLSVSVCLKQMAKQMRRAEGAVGQRAEVSCVLLMGGRGSGEDKVPGRECLLGSIKQTPLEACDPAWSSRLFHIPIAGPHLVEEATGMEIFPLDRMKWRSIERWARPEMEASADTSWIRSGLTQESGGPSSVPEYPEYLWEPCYKPEGECGTPCWWRLTSFLEREIPLNYLKIKRVITLAYLSL